jgi:RimJ/RimL family protein N-acetyltransferase
MSPDAVSPEHPAARERSATIRRLVAADVIAYRNLMLEAYEMHVDAFTSSAAERATLPMSWWERRLRTDPAAAEIVIGALLGDTLAGVTGLSFEPREKAKHKATLFGMYVPRAQRRRGLGRQLVMAALTHARHRQGTRLVQLTVTQGNNAAELLYRRCGFIPFGLEPFAMAVGGGYVSKVHMWCDLESPASA